MQDEPNLSEIAAFVAVVECGGFSSAALALGVAKSSVSRRVGSLEHKLRARLLQRTSRQMMLTEVGRVYHAHVSAAMGALRDASVIVGDLHTTPRGHLRITAPVDMGRLLARLIVGFNQAYPEVTTELSLTQRMVDLVGEGFDVALRAGALRDSSLVGRVVGDSAPILMASPAYLERRGTPKTPAELAAHDFVVFRAWLLRPGVGQIVLRDPSGEQSVELRGVTSADDFVFIRDLLVEGAGIGMVPSLTAVEELERGALVRVLAPWRGRTGSLSVVYPSRDLVPAKTRAFRDYVVEWMAASLPQCLAHVLEVAAGEDTARSPRPRR